jgi:NADH-quinone oxidoreductase subunit C
MASEDHGSAVLRRLLEAHPEAVTATHAALGDATAVVREFYLREVMRFLRDDPALRFEMLSDVCAVDYLPRVPRFEVVYHLYSLAKNHRLRVKVLVDGKSPSVPSMTALWPSADWMEREVFDLYGIRFEGHSDLRRILLYDEFEGYPLRKDYPKERRQPLVGPRN